MEWVDTKTVFTILHIFGVVLGAGGAYLSDWLFFNSISDGKMNETELRLMKAGSVVVWVGLLLLIGSGLLLFSTNPAGYLASSKFMVKMSIVGIIALNGFFLHTRHMPHLTNHQELKLVESESFMKQSTFLVASGAISIVSWSAAIILGGLRTIPYSYLQGMSAYLVVVGIAIIISTLLKERILKGRT